MRHAQHPVILLYINVDLYIYSNCLRAKRNETLTWCHHPHNQLFIGSGRAAAPGGPGEPAEPTDGQPGAGRARGIRVLFLHDQGNGGFGSYRIQPHPKNVAVTTQCSRLQCSSRFSVYCALCLVACLHPFILIIALCLRLRLRFRLISTKPN